MSAEDKKILQSIKEAITVLPERKREYLQGYAKGVLDMANASKEVAVEAQVSA